ncbi:UbiD family decarboxylase [Geomesophilobacter sediminis]|uniref:UbiD family decarboxylase n=1 Tax=Geomesophilobacter sediminis TaxID=2798584 RepID=A0A8J7SAV9_9BACT|nr:UbiD family decarboxylase [Geomesophilobacter sediminis]MBJ6727476.1 UbiD family decarboxylase [Geomesophilobacter sediminis]
MGYRNLQQCVADLERQGRLIRIDEELSPELEIGSIQRRVYQAGGPALLFTRVKGGSFPMLGNLFGTLERTRYIFRDTLRAVERLVQLKIDPRYLLKDPAAIFSVVPAALHLLPKMVGDGPVLAHRTTLDQLPQLKSWPDDGGAFITLPQVYSESVHRPGVRHSNLGMYRVQISGGEYSPNEEVGLHYQIHRGIGFHHAEAIDTGAPFRVNVFVGGAPSMTVAAVMPLPEGMPELSFAGLLGGHRIEMVERGDALPIPAEADFCICGTVDPSKTLPEGPFGDHLGYYSLAHQFPVLKVEEVFHREGAIWPFTTVGRPPQEDTSFGEFIHELTGPLIPTVISGVKAVHAVDAAGVHPLLLAIGSERYVPYGERRRPQELLTIANAILGQGQLSLAKYLMISAHEDSPNLDVHDIPAFLAHVLERIDLRRDLHFQTATTMDTLDYTGGTINEGSKVVFAAVGPKRRTLGTELPAGLRLAEGFSAPAICLPGVIAVKGPQCLSRKDDNEVMGRLCEALQGVPGLDAFPIVVVCDDSRFTAASLNNFLWVTFTRSDPASDIYGVGERFQDKKWGCTGPLIIDARIKPHHAPPLIEDPDVERRIDQLGAAGGPLHGII